MAKYLDPKADVTFKKVFGEHKNLVISLLNALLPLDPGKQVETIEYMTSEMVPETPLGKNSIVDVRCEETGGRKFIVEMQMEWFPDFMQRVLLNASKAYVRQLPKGNDYQLLQPVYSLNLVNHTFEPDMDGYYHYYHLVHDLDSKKVLDGLHIVFVELPKFKAKNLTEKKMQVLWLRFLTEIDENTKKAPKELLDNPHVNEALEIVEESALSDAEMAAYDGFWDRMSREATIKANREEARKKFEEAEEKLGAMTAAREAEKARADAANARADAANARADAATEKLRQTARKMKAKGFSANDISELTGLTADEIKAL